VESNHPAPKSRTFTACCRHQPSYSRSRNAESRSGFPGRLPLIFSCGWPPYGSMLPLGL